MDQKNYVLSEQVLHHLLNYLVQRPYRETAELIHLIQEAQPVEKEIEDE